MTVNNEFIKELNSIINLLDSGGWRLNKTYTKHKTTIMREHQDLICDVKGKLELLLKDVKNGVYDT